MTFSDKTPPVPAVDHDMELSLPVDAPRNVVRKRQQLKARAVAGRHIDEALSEVRVSDETKASRKARLIDLPDGTPIKRRGKGAGGHSA